MEITKLDELTIKISGTTPYEQTVTKDQLIARIIDIDNNIDGLNKRIAELQVNKIEVQTLLSEADKLNIITRDERQAKQPPVESIETPFIPKTS